MRLRPTFPTRRYLATGGSGFIGSAVVRRLAEDSSSVRVLDNGWRGGFDRLKAVGDRCDLVEGDIRDRAAVMAAAEGVDCVIHMAAVNGTRHFYERPELVLDVAIRGMSNVIDACLEHEVPELVVFSSSEVYQDPGVFPTPETVPLVIPDPLNPRYSYAAGKIASELLAINFGRKQFERVIIVRPHNVYGPDMGWEHVLPELSLRLSRLDKEATKGPLRLSIQGTGAETRAFTHIDDFVDGLAHVLGSGQHLGIYHIGTEEEVAIAHVVELLASYLDREVEIVGTALRPGGTSRRCPDISLMKALGFTPRVPLETGLRGLFDWYVEHAHEQPHSDSQDDNE